MIDEKFFRTARGGILYDASRIVKPAMSCLTRDYWSAQRAIEEVSGGRGAIALLRAGDERWVLRHYRRGGWIAKFSRDRYVWSGEAERDRSRNGVCSQNFVAGRFPFRRRLLRATCGRDLRIAPI